MRILPAAAFLLVVCVGPALGASNGTSGGGGTGSGGGSGGGGGGKGKQPKTKAVVVQPMPIITPVNAVVTRAATNATLQCLNATIITWYKSSTGQQLSSGIMADDKTPKYLIADTNLTVMKLGMEDIGIYSCYDATTKANYSAQLMMWPYVEKFNKGQSIVMAEGSPLKLLCATYAFPPPTVTWGYATLANPNEVVPLTVNSTSQAKQPIKINGTLLEIDRMSRQDYFTYYCFSTNSVGVSNSSVMVRVKGKLTALWPFLGIVAEVVILVVIIVVFEKKKAKEIAHKQVTMEEEEKLTMAMQSKGKDEVRQRK